MLGYIIRRLVAAFLVITMTSMIVFALFFLGPTNVAELLCNEGGRCTEERRELLEEALGLNESVVTQYGEWAKGLVVDRTVSLGAEYECSAPCLGISFRTKREVTTELIDKYPATFSIALGGAAIYLVLGTTLGVLAARRRGSAADRALVSGSLLLSSIPYYIVALLAWLYLVNQFKIFPESTYVPFTENPAKWFLALLLPWLVIGITNSTQYARFSRGTMVETLGEDYVRTAAAKGLPENKVVFKHGLRAAIVPIVTIFGLDFAALLSGTIFTEQIFGIDGIGRWGLTAIPVDFPVISATVLVSAVLIVLANLIVDVVYSFLDPRVRLA